MNELMISDLYTVNATYPLDSIHLKTINLLRMFNCVQISKIKELNIQDRNKLEINYFLENYYDKYTGLYLKSKNFLEQIK